MKIHIIGTVTGEENEGMRNISTHLGREFERTHTVTYSALRDIVSIVKNAPRADITFVFARATGKIYSVLRIAERFSKKLCMALVQKPDALFIEKCRKRPPKCDYLCLTASDAENLTLSEGKQIFPLSVGIDAEKFSPVTKNAAAKLKEKYGFDTRPVILHVGHLSSGRGLEDFLLLDPEKYNLLVVASGLFGNAQTEAALIAHDVKIIKEYQPHINELYQLADAYFFCTKSTEFVINIPLSVMESLACGTAAVAFNSFPALKSPTFAGGGIIFAKSTAEIPDLCALAVEIKSEKTYLAEAKTWNEVADKALKNCAGGLSEK